MKRTAVPDQSHIATCVRPLSWHLRLAGETAVMALFVVAIATGPALRIVLMRLTRALVQRTSGRKFALQRQVE